MLEALDLAQSSVRRPFDVVADQGFLDAIAQTFTADVFAHLNLTPILNIMKATISTGDGGFAASLDLTNAECFHFVLTALTATSLRDAARNVKPFFGAVTEDETALGPARFPDNLAGPDFVSLSVGNEHRPGRSTDAER
ncbi:MAG: hypothetical protein IT350_11910 [Deltaproteobacteria bacterium]|nr:hypothetical protein [Deltaproteobacteria bacterium]